MSRAIGDDVKVNLSREDQNHIFERVAAALTPRPDKKLLDIEILGKSHQIDKSTPLIQEDDAVGFTKVGLVQAFIVARLKWMKSQKDPALDTSVSFKATSVLLLLDAEHLAAANTRKRLITSLIRTEEPSARPATNELLGKEKLFIDSLLTSRLHRHTKSPNLWSHRHWLLLCFRSYSVPVDLEYELTRIVFISGERHPRNYYAWTHARWLLDTFPPTAAEAVKLVTLVQRWCLGHRNDVSGWACLLHMLEKWPGEVEKVMEQTLDLAQRFAWRNESVWYFMRTLGAMELGEHWRTQLSKAATRMKLSTHSDVEIKTLDAAVSWLGATAAAAK